MPRRKTVQPPDSLPFGFWMACLLELFERLAYFGVRAIIPLYLVRPPSAQGLGLNFREKGLILSVWALVQCMVPMASGALTDRYGYKKSLAVAFCLTSIGYLGMAESPAIAQSLVTRGQEAPAFWVFLAAVCVVAAGTAVFKPAVQGTIARCASNEKASVCWGVFYWIVNVGAALAPMIAATLRGDTAWKHVFYAAAIVTGVNFLLAMLFYREPDEQSPPSRQRRRPSAMGALLDSLRLIWADRRLLLFLACFSGFWLMFMQVWDLLPNFIDEWVDTSEVAPFFGWLNPDWVRGDGHVKPELIVSVNAVSVFFLVIPMSWAVARCKKTVALMFGMIVCVVGFVGSGATTCGGLCCAMIFVFSIGEVVCGPTFSAYIGLIAPAGRKALYMGYSNIPFAVGWAAGGAVGGALYQTYASKTALARRYLVEQVGLDPHVVMDKAQLAAEEALGLLASSLRTDVAGATDRLWLEYDPWLVWCYLGAIGSLATLGMAGFHVLVERKHGLRTDPEKTG